MWLGGRKDLKDAAKYLMNSRKPLSAKELAQQLKGLFDNGSIKQGQTLEHAVIALLWAFPELKLNGIALAEALKAYDAAYSAEDLAHVLVEKFPKLDPRLKGEGLAEALKAYNPYYSAEDLAGALLGKFPESRLSILGLQKLKGEDLAKAFKVYRENYSAKDLAHALVGQFPELKGEGLAEALKVYKKDYSAEDLAHALVRQFPELKEEDLANVLKVYNPGYSAKDLAHALLGEFPESPLLISGLPKELDGEGLAKDLLAKALKVNNPDYSAEDLAEGLAKALKVYREDYSAKDLAHVLVEKFEELDGEDLANVLKVYNPGYSAKDLAHALVGQFPELKGEDLANVLKVYKEDYSAKDLAEGLAKALKAHKADSAKDLAEGLAKVLKAYKADHPVKDLADVLALEFGKMGVQDRISMLQSAFPDKLREILEDLMKPKLSPLSRAEMIKNVDIDDQDLYQLVKVIINKQSDQLELVAEAIATVKPHLETNTLLEAIFRSFSKNPEDTSVKTYEKQESKIIICAIAIEKAKAKAVEKEPPTKEYLTKVALQFFKHKKLYMDDDFINKKKLTSIIKLLQSNIDIGRDLSSSKSYESVRREADSLISFRKNEGCEVTDILTAEIMKDMSTHTSTTEKIVREELEKAQKGEQEQTKKEEQEGQQSKPSASVKHPQCMTHRINNQCELARLMMRCK